MKPKILVIDDDEAILEAIQSILVSNGYDVVTATDESIVKKLHAYTPNLVLLDLWLAESTGSHWYHFFKQRQATKSIPIVLMSASRDLEETARTMGATGILVKPFEMKELLSTVQKNLI